MSYPRRQLQTTPFANQVESIDRAVNAAKGNGVYSTYSTTNYRQGGTHHKYAVAAVAAAAAIHHQQQSYPYPQPRKTYAYSPQESPQQYISPLSVQTPTLLSQSQLGFESASPPSMFLSESPLKSISSESSTSPPKSGRFAPSQSAFPKAGCTNSQASNPWGPLVTTSTTKTGSIWGSGSMW
ncbi:hypothetical protein DIURU_004899 [Diutina rugosa]|uniref:Uncharacterized protein n=1 Tax=Diutina rugosa TaxID=5481 RepID=A0A642UME4_DIURU|nr:uncharacterized protein DIURU_004899 [Diutina rugosa]KAA8898045.1 hypothetical protein DIURU_004899 [Diutina rugosa]